jgi:leucyl-tRNA synthetase
MKSYNFRSIEKKWIKIWDKEKLFEVKKKAFLSPRSKNRYILDMFPYPSGEGLHVGHVEGYTASDIFSRYLRMRGFNVLHPMGWDAFGLPAENYAIKHKIHPEIVVKKNVSNFKRQLKSLGFSYDWSREINTTDPKYYKWTQWIFLKMFEEGLVYQKEMPVNWCPNDKTVLADEEAEGGVCDRCGTKVERRNLKQWMLKITAYADKLLEGLDSLNWPQKVKLMQKNWIGRSVGAKIDFLVISKNSNSKGNNQVGSIEVFTTRADTIFGATYLVIAPEHPILPKIKKEIKNYSQVEKYVKAAKNKSDQERISESKEKTGICLDGVMAINPANKKEIPIWVADYVLPHYASGAIMAVPACDKRDREFALKFGLPIIPVISPDGKTIIKDDVYEGDGILINSGRFSGKSNKDQLLNIVDFVKGKITVEYKLRDWIFSRQRYWGEPIPLVFCNNCQKTVTKIIENKQTNKIKGFSKGELANPGWVAVDFKDLPLKLPKVKNYKPTGNLESPLASIKSWVNTKCPRCGGPARRETNTMPQWAGSCWYYLRYLDPKNDKQILDSKKEKAFMPVDLYIGGVEHAVLHLLYARFWHRFLFDKKIVKDPEPFLRLVNQGLILGSDGEKMSKSRGNVVNPDDVIKNFGADSLRMYEMFMGPLEDYKPWDQKGIVGVWRFLNRVWFYYQKHFANLKKKKNNQTKLDSEFEKFFHQMLKKITQDIEALRFNTAISSLMVLFKKMESLSFVSKKLASDFIIILSPFAPFITEEIWRNVLKNKKSVALSKWPEIDENKATKNKVVMAVQINGKTRGAIEVEKGISKEKVLELISLDQKLAKYINEADIKRVIFVPDKIINILL